MPAELREAIDRKILAGMEYQEIAEYINTMGIPVSRSSVNRYGQRFLSKMEKLRLAREQAKIVLENAKDSPALEGVEAASHMAVQVIMEKLLEMDDIKDAKSVDVFKALALLERSAVQREKLKLDYNRGIKEACDKIKAALKEELGKQPDLVKRLSELVDAKAEEVKQK